MAASIELNEMTTKGVQRENGNNGFILIHLAGSAIYFLRNPWENVSLVLIL